MDGRDSILYRDFSQPKEEAAEQESAFLYDNLAVTWMGKYTEWRDKKKQKFEEDWLEDLRAANSIEDPDIVSRVTRDDPDKSTHYIGITQTKCVQAYSRLIELEFPGPTQKNWALKPTPVPKLAPVAQQQVEQKLQLIMAQMVQAQQRQAAQGQGQGQIQPPDPEEIRKQAEKLIHEKAKDACMRMSAKIEDQLVESGYQSQYEQAELERVQCGSMCFKGPMVRTATLPHWVQGQNEHGGMAWQKIQQEEVVPAIEQPSIFDVYPDSQATEIRPATEVCERHVYNKSELLELLDYPGFDRDKIALVLTEFPGGNYTPQDVDLERQQLTSSKGMDGIPSTPHWEVVECHGSVTGQDLLDLGVFTFNGDGLNDAERAIMEKKQVISEYHCEIWICSHYVLMVKVKPGRPEFNLYMIVPYVKVLNQIWGRGVPRMMKNSRLMINSAARAMMNNAGESQEPYTEINEDVIDAGTDVKKMLKERVVTREGGDMAYPAVRFTNVPSTILENLRIIELGIRLADDETTIPTVDPMAPGSGAAHRTLGGLSMLVGGGNIILKSAVKNSDRYFREPLIERFYNFNMEWSADDSIKGDMRVEALGTASLMAKEVAVQNLIQFFGVGQTPTMEHRVNWNGLLRDFARLSDLDPREAVKSDEEIEAAENDPIKMQQIKLQMEGLAKQIEETQSKIVLNLAKAEAGKMMPEEKQASIVKAFAEIDKLKAETRRIIMEAMESGVNSKIKQFGTFYDYEKLKQDGMALIHNIQQDRKMAQIENKKASHMNDTMRSTNERE